MSTKKPPQKYLTQQPAYNYSALDEFLATPAAGAAPEAEPRGMARAVADTALSFGRGAVQGVRMLSDVAGADNKVSGALRTAEDFIGGLQSAQAKQDQQEIARILEEAENKGVLDQVVAGVKAFAQAPGQTMAQAAGTSLPTLAAALIPGAGPAAVAARLAGPLAVGAAQGAGGVKSSIYDEVKQRALKEGRSPAEAEQLAAQAQEYSSANGGQIALGAGLGAWAGKSGIEGAAQRLVRGTGGDAAQGMVKRVAAGAIAEGIPEAVQGGQEKFAGNTAQTNAGFPTDPWAGVAASATMEGLAGHAMGGAMGIPKGRDTTPVVDPGQAVRDTKLPEGGPMTRAANAGIEAVAKEVDAAAPPPPALGWNQRWEPEGGFSGQAPLYVFPDGSAATRDEAADALAAAAVKNNIDAWVARSPRPMPEPEAGALAQAAELRTGAPMAVLPLPDGAGFTVVPQAWVNHPSVAGYMEQARAAVEAQAERAAAIQRAATDPVERAPRTPRADPVLIDPAAPSTVANFIAQIEATNTPAARAYVADYRAGRVTDADVLARAQGPAAEPTPDERLAAAAAQAPAPADGAGLILNRDGKPFTHERAAIAQQKAKGGTVLQVAGGWAVQPDPAPVEQASVQDPQTAPAPAPATATAQQEGADRAGAGEAPSAAAGSARAGDVGAPAAVEADGVVGGMAEAAAGAPESSPATGQQPAPKKPPFVSKEDGEHLFGIPQKRAKALDRIAKGSAYFGTKDKAKDFITGNGLKDTHEAFEAKPGRFEVRAKGGAAGQSSPAAGQEDARTRRNRLKAERKGDVLGMSSEDTARLAERLADPERNQQVLGRIEAEVAAQTGAAPGPAAAPQFTAGQRVELLNGKGTKALREGTVEGQDEVNVRVRADDGSVVMANPTRVRVAPAPAASSKPADAPAEDDTAADPEMAAYESGLTGQTRAQDKAKVAAAKPAANTVFTEDAAAAARARLKAKLGRLNSGLDPETMMDGITLAGYHVEKGARKFAAYARAMVDDLGDAVKPYLIGWYMAVRSDPRAADMRADMDKASAVEDLDVDEVLATTAEPATDGQPPAETDNGAETGPESQTDAASDDTGASKEPDDERPLQGQGAQALDGVAAAEGGDPEGGGRAGRGTADGRKRNPGQGGRADGAGVPAARGRRGGAAGVRAAEAGAEGAGDAGAAGRTRRKGRGAPQVDAVDDLFSAAEPAVPDAQQIPAANFRITPDLKLGEGGEAEKFRDNLAAIRVLKAIESENRRATAAEQRTLARYVGWGGIPNAFPNPLTKQFKPEWKARGEELQGLLSPPEHRRASNSTTDAHYTSETVTTAVWDAVKRLGFRGGLSLEMSLGSGNFIGLMPEDVAGRTRFIGVELDRITARIAKALYPQATVLESGMQYVPLAANAFDLDIGNPPFGDTSLTWQYSPGVRGLSIHNQFFVAGLNALKPGGIQAKVVSRYLLDAQDSTAREMLAVKGKLLGAIRLPETAFKTNARTQVVTDIVFFQRREKFEEEDVQQALYWLKAPLSRADFNKLDGAGKERYTRLTEKYQDELQWVATGKVPDHLGGEPMVVSRYFVQNPDMVVGKMDRSGSMQHGADVTVKLPAGADFAAELAKRIQKLPEGVMDRSDDAIDAAIERHKSMADALEIAVSGQEPGQMVVNSDGKLMQVFERETPEGEYELGRREITADSPWSGQLFMDAQGRWYREVVKLGADGKPLKLAKKDGSPGTRNVTEREVFGSEDKVPENMRLGQTRLERLRDIAGLRDLLKRQLVLEAQDDSAAKMEANRADLAKAYDAYVAKHGFVSDSLTGALVNDMPDGALVQALELSFKPAISKEKAAKTGDQPREASAKRAPIMSRRVVVPYAPPGKADTATDAMQISLAERGFLDVDRIADLRGISADEAAAELTEGERPLAFRDPETGRLETRDAYLTGEVARKLRAARDAGLSRNVQALEAVQPEPITSDNVTVILGTSWVPNEVYADFATHLTGEPAVVRFEPLTNTRMLSGKNSVKSQEWASRGKDGRIRVEAIELLQDAMNSKATKVYDYSKDDGPQLNKADTEIAEAKRKEIEREFAEWVFADSDRRRLLVARFNEKFNTRVTRQHDGSHLILPGKVPDSIISMRRHQKNAIWRGISERFMLLDHVVGAGKTYTAIARVMERRRMGLSRKPMIVVPNHMVEQFAADVYRLYPGAKVLAAGKKDFERRARRRLFGKIATGDWDVVVVPHSSFQFIGLSPETEDAFLQEEMRQAMKALSDAEANQEPGTRFKTIGVKKAEALVKKIEARIDAVKAGNKDRLLTFEQMGVDDLTVDEAHEFKNLFYSTQMDNVRGMGDSSGSGKAFDLYTKVRYLRSTPTGSVVFMTGTPISNSAVEMFTMMRYLAADELRELGLEHFDAWRTQFVDASMAYEQQLTGGVKEVARLGRVWGNARSLMDLYYSFTDAVTIEDIKAAFAEDNPGKSFPVPKVKGGNRQEVIVKPSQALVEMLTDIFKRYEDLPNIEDVQERNATRLRLMDLARKASLDMRAVDPTTTSKEEGGKLDRVADEVARLHKQWTPDLGTQLIFLDRSVPKAKSDAAELKAYDKALATRDKALADGKEDAYRDAVEALEKFDANAMAEMRAAQAGGWTAYQQIKDNLIARGIPANEIRFIQEANNDEQKQAIFDAVKAGEIRVLIGSTQRMGAGTNVQDRLVGLHHVDVGWKPSDIEQREGRIVRQGNLLLEKYGDQFEVEVLAYATERTADASLWALNGMKLKTINGIRKYDGSFVMEFEDEDSLSMAQMAALASGDPMLLERIELVGEIDKLERLENSHRRRLLGLRDRIEEAERTIKAAPANIKANEDRAKLVLDWEAKLKAAKDARSVTVEGVTYQGESADFKANTAALAAIKEQQGEDEKAKFAITIDGKRITSKTGVENAITSGFGDVAPFEATIFGEKHTTRAGAVRLIVEKARELAINMEPGQSEGFDIGDTMGVKLVGDVSRSAWGKSYDVTISLLDADGKTLASEQSRDGAQTHDFSTQFVRAVFDRIFSGTRGSAYESAADYYRRQLERTTQEVPELKRQLEAAGPFKQADELAQKRERLEEVTRLLSAGGKDLKHIDDFGMLFTADPQSVGQDDFGTQIDLAERPAYSRAAAGGQPGVSRAAEVQALVQQIAARWTNAPEVVVVDSLADPRVPAEVRADDQTQQSQGAEGAPEGFFHGGKVYLVAPQLPGDADVVRVLMHEALGHYGLRGVFGAELGTILDRVAILQAAKVRAKAKQYGLDVDKPSERRMAAEEVLAEMAQGVPELGWGRKTIAAVRSWLREHIPGFAKMALTDAEIVRSYILPARAFVQRGGPSGGPGGGVRFSRAQGEGGSTAMFSRASVADAVRNFNQAGARNAFLDAVTTHGATNFWHRTVGTQYHKAKAHPTTFGRVFDAVQDYIKDTSSFANQAADLAPTLLPKLDNWTDLKKGGWRHHGANPADTAKAGEAIFRGTLDKVLYDDATLRSRFGLNDLQVGLYHEFRRATDESLNGMAKSEMLRLAGDAGRAMRAQVLAAPDAAAAAKVLTKHLTELAELTADEGLLDTAEQIDAKVTRVTQLQAEGYAPLMRFGKHTLHVQRKDGSTEFFGMYESVREANQAARLLRADPALAGMRFEQGVMSEEGHKLFSGMSLDSLELFADATGNADNPVYQDYLKLAISNRSAMKRMIERKAIAGYSEDVGRVLASFVTSNARMAAGNLHLSEAKKAAEAIPKEQGDLRDEAINLVSYATEPQEEAAAFRNLLFISFIGGSVASALVNMTQPITMTLPYLTQFGGVAKATKRLVAAMAMVASGKGMGADLAKALARAEQDGIVSPQEIHHLQAEAMNTLGKHPFLKKAGFVWGAMFSLAEQFNRRVSFVAAYQSAEAEGIADPFGFAERAVVETQGLYNRGNKANWARGAVGATAMTFKQFSTHYLEWLVRMAKSGPEGRKAVAVALALLLLTAGAGGLPFADDLDDLIDTLGQAAGYDTNSKRAKREFIAQTLGMGDVAAEVFTRGLTALPGMPVDLSLRMGMGNLLPATGLLLRSNTDTSRQLLEVAGAAGGLASNIKDGAAMALGGDVTGGLMKAAPVAVQNMAKAIEMWNTGEYRNTKGAKVMDVDAVDGGAKFLGFQPAAVARESARVGETMRTVQLARNVESEIAGRWAQGLADGDTDAVAQARQELAAWNKKNPQAPIRINMPQILSRVRALRSSRAERTIKAAPKELRGAVAEGFK